MDQTPCGIEPAVLSKPEPLDLVDLATHGIPPIPWLVEPYLVEGEIHLLVGDGSTGKTFLALDTAIGLAAGETVFTAYRPSRPYRVLYIDEDGGRAQIVRRVLGLATGRRVIMDRNFVDRLAIYSGDGFRLDDEAGWRKLESVIQRHKPEVLILDALRAFHTGSENESQQMTLVLRHRLRVLANIYKLTVILIHHTSKEPADAWPGHRTPAKASRGSTEIRNAVDTLLFAEAKGGVSTLRIDKTRNLDQASKPDLLAFCIRQEADQSMWIERVQGAAAQERPKLARATQDLLEALPLGSDDELSHRQLMERLPGLKEHVYSARTARDALRDATNSVLDRRQEGRNTFYRRRRSGTTAS